jgi:hypothetical protein
MFNKKKKKDKDSNPKKEQKIQGLDKKKDKAEGLLPGEFFKEPIPDETEDTSDAIIIKPAGDKIFGNDYNTGNIDHEVFSDLKVDAEYSGSYLDSFYNSEEYVERKDLDEKIMKLFSESRWSNFSIRKKFPKDHLPHIFNYLRKGLDKQGHTSVDMFIAIAEFLDVNYEKLYELIGVKYKEELLVELEGKYKLISGKKEKRLF